MKTIPLSKGMNAIVDEEDYDYVRQWKWNAHRSKAKTFIARRTIWVGGKSHEISMHRLIMNTPKGMECDHINHEGLDNRKSNLRNCYQSQNAKNRSAYGRCKYLGVSHVTNSRTFAARIYSNGVPLCLGTYKHEWAAAIAYDEAAKKYHGEFANLNFKEI